MTEPLKDTELIPTADLLRVVPVPSAESSFVPEPVPVPVPVPDSSPPGQGHGQGHGHEKIPARAQTDSLFPNRDSLPD